MASTKLTEKSQEALIEAQRLAEDGRNPTLEGLHVLAALLDQSGGIVPLALQSAGIDPRTVRGRVDAELGKLPKAAYATQVAMGEELRRLLREAEDEATKLKDDYVSTEHLLLSLASGNGLTAKVLGSYGLTRDAILAALTKIRGNQRVTDANPEDKFDALAKYGRDLTELARAGQARPRDRP